MVEQLGGSFTPSVSTTRAGNVPFQAYAKSTEIRRRSCLSLLPLNFGNAAYTPDPISNVAALPLSQYARTLLEIEGRNVVQSEMSTNSSDRTSLVVLTLIYAPL